MKKAKKICYTIALLGTLTMLFSNCKKDDDNGKAGTVKDIDGNVYKTVKIGEQVWMAENLKATKYRNGNPIEYSGSDNNAWQSNTTGAYAWYDNDINWKDNYDALYNWHAINNNNGLCPTGWHVPSDAEWTQLVDYVVAQGFPNEPGDPIGAGNALKSCRQVNSPQGGDCDTSEHPRWYKDEYTGSNHHGFDEFGFSGVPGGFRSGSSSFHDIGTYSYFWSSTEFSSNYAQVRYLDYYLSDVSSANNLKGYGFSVRCIKD